MQHKKTCKCSATGNTNYSSGLRTYIYVAGGCERLGENQPSAGGGLLLNLRIYIHSVQLLILLSSKDKLQYHLIKHTFNNPKIVIGSYAAP